MNLTQAEYQSLACTLQNIHAFYNGTLAAEKKVRKVLADNEALGIDDKLTGVKLQLEKPNNISQVEYKKMYQQHKNMLKQWFEYIIENCSDHILNLEKQGVNVNTMSRYQLTMSNQEWIQINELIWFTSKLFEPNPLTNNRQRVFYNHEPELNSQQLLSKHQIYGTFLKTWFMQMLDTLYKINVAQIPIVERGRHQPMEIEILSTIAVNQDSSLVDKYPIMMKLLFNSTEAKYAVYSQLLAKTNLVAFMSNPKNINTQFIQIYIW